MPQTLSHKTIGVVLGVLLAGWISAAIVATLQPVAEPPPPRPPAEPQEPWRTYRSETHGIALTYPPSWIVATPAETPGLVAAFETEDTARLIQQGRVNPNYRYQLSIRVWPTIADHPLAKKYAADVKTVPEFLARVPTVAPEGEVTVGGLPGYSYLTNDGHQFYGVLIPRDGKIYALHFERSWTKARFEADAELTKILASVKFDPLQRPPPAAGLDR